MNIGATVWLLWLVFVLGNWLLVPEAGLAEPRAKTLRRLRLVGAIAAGLLVGISAPQSGLFPQAEGALRSAVVCGALSGVLAWLDGLWLVRLERSSVAPSGAAAMAIGYIIAFLLLVAAAPLGGVGAVVARTAAYLSAGLLLSRPVNRIVRYALDDAALAGIGRSEQPFGRTIGTLERWLTLLLVVAGQPAGVALVVAAKSIARFERLTKDARFAEYYLVGTLASLLSAFAVGFALIGAGRAHWF